jgi:WD40 repeat protein
LVRVVTRAAPERGQILDVRWLRARLPEVGLDGVLADLRLFRDEPEVAEVLWALELSAAALAADPHQLSGQLVGRLMGSRWPRVRGLVATLESGADGPWLQPRTPSLTAPGGPLRRILWAHSARPAPVALCAGDRKVVVAFQEGTLRVWDLASGQEEAAFGGAEEADRAPAASAVAANGRLALCGYADGALRLRRPGSGRLLLALAGHGGRVNALALLGGGARALSASEDGTARLWDLAAGVPLAVFTGHGGRVNAVTALPGERAALSAGGDGGLRLWDLATGAELRRWEVGGLLIHQLALHGAGRVLVAGEDGSVSLLELGGDFAAPRARRLAVGRHDGPVTAVAMAADGERALSASTDGTLRLWRVALGGAPRVAGVPRVIAAHTAAITGLAMDAAGRLAVSVSADGTVKLWDLAADLSPRRRGHTAAVTALAVSRSGRRAISGSQDSTVRLWDLEDGAELLSLGGHERFRVEVVALLEEPRQVVTASAGAGEIHVWDLDQRRLLRKSAGPRGWVPPVTVTADGRYAVCAAREGRIAIFDLRGEEPRERWLGGPHGADSATALAVTADSRRLLAGAGDGTVTVWDLAAGKAIATHSCHRRGVTAIAAAGDGSMVVSGSEDGTLRSWNSLTGRHSGSRQAHPARIASVAISGDGRLAASAAGTRLILWDLAGGCAPLCAFTADSALDACALSPDGRLAVAGEASGRLHFLSLRGGGGAG